MCRLNVKSLLRVFSFMLQLYMPYFVLTETEGNSSLNCEAVDPDEVTVKLFLLLRHK